MNWRSLQERLRLLQQNLQRTLRPRWRLLQLRLLRLLRTLQTRSRPLRDSLRQTLQDQSQQWQALWRRLREVVQQRLPQTLPAWWPRSEPPLVARRIVDGWHKGECWVAVACFGFIAGILILDVLGRELLGPLLRLLGIEPGATGIFASQKLSVFALVIGSFAGIGIATATGAHIVPGFASGWVPAEWRPAYQRAADLLTGLFLLGVVSFGLEFVGSSFRTDLRAPVLDWPVWPIQLAIPLGFLSAAGRYFLYAAWPALKPASPEFQE
jgi:TRAP-type C4-dicarboxylate transport system permease small subunit